jgi:hypothetical protein
VVIRCKVIDTVIGYREPVLLSYCMIQSVEPVWKLTKDRLCLLNDRLDVHWQLLRLSSNIATCSGNYEWIGIAIRILKVESFEEDGRGGDHPLTVGQFLAEL